MNFNIVLIEPEIPMNTGNIGRLSLATRSHLHLVKPLGFEINDTRLKRAGLDYWKHITLSIYDNTDEFFKNHQGKKMAFFSSHGKKDLWSVDYEKDMFLVFGKESVGLSEKIKKEHSKDLYSIPLYSDHVRSLNLANAVSVVTYEGLRSLRN